MVEFEPGNDLGSWEIMFWCFCMYFDVFYKLLVACPLSRRVLFFGQKVRPRIFGPAFVRFCDFSSILGPQEGSYVDFLFVFLELNQIGL